MDHAAHYLAMKRAADWGQVNHCLEYDMVFVTHDKPAFLYAIFVRCPAILVTFDLRFKDDGCLAYAFAMFAPEGCRQRLHDSKPIVRPGSMKGGRSNGRSECVRVRSWRDRRHFVDTHGRLNIVVQKNKHKTHRQGRPCRVVTRMKDLAHHPEAWQTGSKNCPAFCLWR